MADLTLIATTLEKMLAEVRTNATALAVMQTTIEQIRKEQMEAQQLWASKDESERETMRTVIEMKSRLDNGLIEKLNTVAEKQEEMTVTLTQHSMIIKIIVGVSVFLVSSTVSVLIKVFL